jgi:2-iminobutanoate/2-iminopropanoate deaminase
MDIDVILPDGETPEGASFSPALRAGGWVFPSGQVGERPDGTVPDSFEEEAALALDNLESVLLAAGSDLAHVVRMEVILADMGDFAGMNEVYRERMNAPLPARYTHGSSLAPGYRVEFVATAVVAD